MRITCCVVALLAAAVLSGCQGVSHPAPVQLAVNETGTGKGVITSNPAGINCPNTCTATFNPGTTVVLTAAPALNTKFNGWSGACSGTGTCSVVLSAGASVTASFTGPPLEQLSVTLAGRGSGTVTSNPAGINCPQSCSGNFPKGTQVMLTATPATGFPFAGWAGACSGTSNTCKLTINSAQAATATFNGALQSLNHIIFLAQENRSFDHYFGALREYWAQNGFSDQAFDGLPQFNIPAGTTPTNPGCDPTSIPPAGCNASTKFTPVPSFHLLTQCIENPSPSWNESHVDRNLSNPVATNATMDGFVQAAADDARRNVPPYLDVEGFRAMGYYDGTDLNYYYFMASSFATSDRWFSPVLSRTQPNRMYLAAATSQGHVYPLLPGVFLTANTIFQELQNAGLSWKIYVNSQATGCSDTDSACLSNFSQITWFTFGQQMKANPSFVSQHVQSINAYLRDVANGTLPNVALIEPAYGAALDEHPTVNDLFPTRIQAGAAYVANQLINPLVNSPSWKDSAFILTWDEGGGLYDHVPPLNPVPNPDGTRPNDLLVGDICTATPGAPTCDFTYSGYRVPMIVVSPFARKHYVSHTPTDYTAILKLIETRFKLSNLTARDAASMDMTEFFDFVNVPSATPPKPPLQSTTDTCNLSPPTP